MNDRAEYFEHEVLQLFQQISEIPRGSGREQAVSDWIRAWAQARGFAVIQDEIWNLLICKPASPGYEEHPPVMLQAHIDMVCEKNADSGHDFTRDPIRLRTDGEWIVSADGTTLGADDGIGVAAAMAILADDRLAHPPLEVVFTVQEETTFAGAETVDISPLRAMRMINLDHSCERELIVGSCGGTGVTFTLPLAREASAPAGWEAYQVRLTGLKGGHSGEDIHRGRGNAITLLLRLLEKDSLRVISFAGGTNRLAIPREAEAVVLAPDRETMDRCAEDVKADLAKEYADAAPDLELGWKAAQILPAEGPLTEDSFRRAAGALRLYPNGINNMNGSFEGLVESSDNIGILSMEKDRLVITSEVRGAYQSTVDDLVKTIRALAELLGAEVTCFNGYVPWEYEAESRLRSLAVRTYEEMYRRPMKQIALHAGLECGFFAGKRPGMEIISIGPDCEFFHSPRERVRTASVEKFYEYLKTLLQRL